MLRVLHIAAGQVPVGIGVRVREKKLREAIVLGAIFSAVTRSPEAGGRQSQRIGGDMGGGPSRQEKTPFDDYAAATQPQQSHPRKLGGLRQVDIGEQIVGSTESYNIDAPFNESDDGTARLSLKSFQPDDKFDLADAAWRQIQVAQPRNVALPLRIAFSPKQPGTFTTVLRFFAAWDDGTTDEMSINVVAHARGLDDAPSKSRTPPPRNAPAAEMSREIGHQSTSNFAVQAHDALAALFTVQHDAVGTVASEEKTYEKRDDTELGSALAKIAVTMGTAAMAAMFAELAVPILLGGAGADEAIEGAAADEVVEGTAAHTPRNEDHGPEQTHSESPAPKKTNTALPGKEMHEVVSAGLVGGMAEGFKDATELANDKGSTGSKNPDIAFIDRQYARVISAGELASTRLSIILGKLAQQHPQIVDDVTMGVTRALDSIRPQAAEKQADATAAQWVEYKARQTFGAETVKTTNGDQQVSHLENKPRPEHGQVADFPIGGDGLLELVVTGVASSKDGINASGARVVAARIKGISQLVADRLLNVNLRASGVPIMFTGDIEATIDEIGRVKAPESVTLAQDSPGAPRYFNDTPKEQTSADAQRVVDVLLSKPLATWGISKVETDDKNG